MRTVVVRVRQLSGNRYGGRFTIAAAVGTSRGRRLRFVPERDLGTVEGAGTREEIARFSVSLADEAMRRHHADVALVDVAGDIRRLGAEGRSSGRAGGRGMVSGKRAKLTPAQLKALRYLSTVSSTSSYQKEGVTFSTVKALEKHGLVRITWTEHARDRHIHFGRRPLERRYESSWDVRITDAGRTYLSTELARRT